VVAVAGLLVGAGQQAGGNGGPFVVKYPSGDPAAKGVLARLDPSLQPARETRLRVVEEQLSIALTRDRFSRPETMPLAQVAAHYTIENPTAAPVPMDFGFPVLRGIYLNPLAMMPRPEVTVTVDGKSVPTQIISNSLIYAVIRQRAREAIEKGVAADAQLAALVAAVRPAAAASPQSVPPASEATRAALAEDLTTRLRWNARDAALLVEYPGLDFGPKSVWPRDRWLPGFGLGRDAELRALLGANLGPLAAIGEQKATQFFAQLAGQFDRSAAAEYEAIFHAWGGEVRERSLDLPTGHLRPREFDLPKEKTGTYGYSTGDVTIYARLDYLDDAQLSPREKETCRNVLKNLPVVFTFAPMNLIYYQVEFPPHARREVVVRYAQYAYLDTREPASYQLSYVLHPASLWESFGPIQLAVRVAEGVAARASVPWAQSAPAWANQTVALLKQTAVAARDIPSGDAARSVVYKATLTEPHQRTGELFIALDKAAWDRTSQGKL
jgi:hypothetical protein